MKKNITSSISMLGLAMAGSSLTSDSATLYTVNGWVKPGFEEVEQEFRQNFLERGELGAACCIYYKGEKVVDLWGGYRTLDKSEPWEENTVCRVYSTSKGMALLVIAKLNSDGFLDYEEKVSTYWPEFGQNGKSDITIEQLLTHKSGVVLLERKVKVSELHDFAGLAVLLENAEPLWEPGSKHGYHSATIGLYMQQLVQRIDPEGRTIGQYFTDEIAAPLGVDFFIGLPDSMDSRRLAEMKLINPLKAMLNIGKAPREMRRNILQPNSLLWKSMLLIENDMDSQYEELRYEEASGGGAGEARALAKVYGLLAVGGAEIGLTPETVHFISKSTDPPEEGIRDEVMGWKSLGSSGGFSKPYPVFQFAGDSAYGFSGTGGSLAFADPEKQIGYAYVMNKMGYYNINDPRESALRQAMYACISRLGE